MARQSKTKSMETKNKKNQSDWKNLVQGFVGDMLERISDNVSKKVHIFFDQLKRRTIGAILISIGSIFFLISVAILINTVFNNEFPWIGWSLVGLVAILVGYRISKD
jgi:sorbitol-specific phosphotransferase system component IIBC